MKIISSRQVIQTNEWRFALLELLSEPKKSKISKGTGGGFKKFKEFII